MCRAPYGYTFAEIGDMTIAQVFAALEEPRKRVVPLEEYKASRAKRDERKVRWAEVILGHI